MPKCERRTGTLPSKHSSHSGHFKHLSIDERYRIQYGLQEKESIRKIAKDLKKAPSTILREIQNRTETQRKTQNCCKNKSGCTKHGVCGSPKCRRPCKNCIQCTKYCDNYEEAACEILKRPPYVCNGCPNIPYCSYEKRMYRAVSAQKIYRELLVDRRSGHDLTLEELNQIDELASPLLKQGLSPYHVCQSLGSRLPVSESTLRRMISYRELDARNIDLRNQVKRKQRNKPKECSIQDQISKVGHLYGDYRAYTEQNSVNVTEMDCVEGKKEDSAVILTLHMTQISLQLGIILERQTCDCVVEALDRIEEALGKELFSLCFEVILTDNGKEFSDHSRIERSIYGGTRTKVFYCEPNRPDEKGSCENNHRLIRYVIPKGTSLEPFMQSDISLMMNHINSYRRKQLYGHSPYEIAKQILPEDFFILLGLEEIPDDAINLTPELLKRQNISE